MSGTILVDQAFAATLPEGSVAIITYGNKVVALFAALGVTAVGVAVLPYFSLVADRQEWGILRKVVLRPWEQ